jgi:hypothetical protein
VCKSTVNSVAERTSPVTRKVTNKVSKIEMIRQTITFIKINSAPEYHAYDNSSDAELEVVQVNPN